MFTADLLVIGSFAIAEQNGSSYGLTLASLSV
jgi:hypothetical protein